MVDFVCESLSKVNFRRSRGHPCCFTVGAQLLIPLGMPSVLDIRFKRGEILLLILLTSAYMCLEALGRRFLEAAASN